MIEREIRQLSKLKGKSLRELRVRAMQELGKLSERIPGFSGREMSDSALLGCIVPRERERSPLATALRIRERIKHERIKHERIKANPTSHSEHHLFFPSLTEREPIVAVMKERFPDERRRLIDRAERAIRGRFDLLGIADISFGHPIDWHLEPISGKRVALDHWSRISYLDPETSGDKKIIWELNRHQHFVTFGQAYWLSGDERFAAAFVEQATSWMDANPPGRGINWVSSLELAFRSISWLWALYMLAGAGPVTSEFLLRLLKYMVAQGRHIESYLSYYFSPNTHLTGEALGLFYLGTALPELKPSARWRNLGLTILLEQLPIQVRADGVYFEQATYYHRYSTDFYTHLVALARASQMTLPPDVEARLAGMLDHLMWITRPNGESPLTGDDDGGRLLKLGVRDLDDFRDTLATGAALFGRGDWKHVAGKGAVETLWLLGPEGLDGYDEIKSRPHGKLSHAFEESGYYIMRDGWREDSSYTLIDCGPHGAINCGHSHADALSFEFASHGKAWLIDPGTFTYTADARARDEFRETSAHNTVTVDAESQSVPAGPFSWHHIAQTKRREFISEDGFSYFEGSHDGYERLSDPVVHNRAIFFAKAENNRKSSASLSSYLVIRDKLSAAGRHGYEIKYLFSAGSSAVASDNRVRVTEPGGGRLDIFAVGREIEQAKIANIQVSRGYGQREQSLAAVFKAEAEGSQSFTTLIIPSTKKETIHVEHKEISDSAHRFFIRSGDMLDMVLTGEETSTIACEGLSLRGSLAWARFRGGELIRACMLCGQSLEIEEEVALHLPERVRYLAIIRAGDRFEVSVNGTDRFSLPLQKNSNSGCRQGDKVFSDKVLSKVVE